MDVSTCRCSVSDFLNYASNAIAALARMWDVTHRAMCVWLLCSKFSNE